MYDKKGFIYKERADKMNFHDKRTRRIVAIIILVVIAAMVATTIIPYIMG